MDNNNNTANNIALDPSQMAPQDSPPLVQTGSTQPAVVDITPRDFSTPDPLSAPVAPVIPTPVVAEPPVTPVAAPTPSIVDITPSADPLSTPVPPMSTPVAEPMVTTPIAPAAPTQAPSSGSLVDIISASVPQPVAPETTTAPTPSAPVVPQVPVLQTNPLTEDPNAVNTIG